MKLLLNRYYNYAIDFLLLYGFIAIVVSSYILWFVLPMGRGRGGSGGCEAPFSGEGWRGNDVAIFELVRFEWVELHSWFSIVVFCVILIHLILHWQWIVEAVKRIKIYILNSQKLFLERYVAAFTLFILTAIEVLSGFVLWIVLPRGVGDLYPTQQEIGRIFWGLQRNEWVDLHAWVAVFMVAIIIVHVVIHWRWIVNITLGKIKPNKTLEKAERINDNSMDKCKFVDKAEQSSHLLRSGVLLGITGAVGFLVEMLTFQLDWVGRYEFMLYFIPVPFIILMLAKKYPFLSGILLIALGILTLAFYLIFPIGIRWNIIGVWNELGLETIYTVVFVTMPLVISGILILMYKRFKYSSEIRSKLLI